MTLAIIDMQPKYSACQSVVDDVCEAVEQAKRAKDYIVVVELVHDCELGRPNVKTHASIMKAIGNYRYCEKTTKVATDGSKEIIAVCKKNGFDQNNFSICGVNRCACVADTISGLHKLNKSTKITILESAVGCFHQSACSSRCGKYKTTLDILKHWHGLESPYIKAI